jgi:hypothetical protein
VKFRFAAPVRALILPRAAAPSLVLALALAGCAGPAVLGTVSTGAPAPPTTDASPVDSAIAQSLETAPDGSRISYQPADGLGGSMVIGPLYQSGRGIPCRLGRAGPPATGYPVPTSYPFCRIGGQWYAMKPVVISGY